MITLEMRNLAGGEVIHACPAGMAEKPLPGYRLLFTVLPLPNWSTATLPSRWPKPASG